MIDLELNESILDEEESCKGRDDEKGDSEDEIGESETNHLFIKSPQVSQYQALNKCDRKAIISEFSE